MSFFFVSKIKVFPSKCRELNSLQEYVTIVTVSFFNRNIQSTISLNLFRKTNLLRGARMSDFSSA